jgi:hypothetical protein
MGANCEDESQNPSRAGQHPSQRRGSDERIIDFLTVLPLVTHQTHAPNILIGFIANSSGDHSLLLK